MHRLAVGQDYHSHDPTANLRCDAPASDATARLDLFAERLSDDGLDAIEGNAYPIGVDDTLLPEMVRRLHSECFPRRRLGLPPPDRCYQTADPTLRIAKALGTTPEFWLNLQRISDLDRARATTNLDGTVPLVESS